MNKEVVKAMQEPLSEVFGEKLNQDKCKDIINVVFDKIGDLIASGEKVDISGFGKFESVERASRKGVNPSTGESIVIPAMNAPKFKSSKALKDKVNGK